MRRYGVSYQEWRTLADDSAAPVVLAWSKCTYGLFGLLQVILRSCGTGLGVMRVKQYGDGCFRSDRLGCCVGASSDRGPVFGRGSGLEIEGPRKGRGSRGCAFVRNFAEACMLYCGFPLRSWGRASVLSYVISVHYLLLIDAGCVSGWFLEFSVSRGLK